MLDAGGEVAAGGLEGGVFGGEGAAAHDAVDAGVIEGEVDDGLDDGLEFGPGVAGVGGEFLIEAAKDLGEAAADDGEVDLFFAGPVEIDGAFADVGTVGDVFEADFVEGSGCEEVGRGVEDSVGLGGLGLGGLDWIVFGQFGFP